LVDVPEQHPEWSRVQKLVRAFFLRMMAVEDEFDAQVALDDVALVAIPVVHEDDERVSETVMAEFTTQRGHAQVGMLRLAYKNAEQDFLAGQSDDDD
jgi:hypothetical protein